MATTKDLSPDETQVLLLLSERGTMFPINMRSRLNKDIPEIVKILKSLRKKHLVLFDDSFTKKVKGWELTEERHQLIEEGL